MTTTVDLPIYNEIVEQLDFSPEVINVKCKQLLAFRWAAPAIPSSKPIPGAKPVRRKARR